MYLNAVVLIYFILFSNLKKLCRYSREEYILSQPLFFLLDKPDHSLQVALTNPLAKCEDYGPQGLIDIAVLNTYVRSLLRS